MYLNPRHMSRADSRLLMRVSVSMRSSNRVAETSSATMLRDLRHSEVAAIVDATAISPSKNSR